VPSEISKGSSIDIGVRFLSAISTDKLVNINSNNPKIVIEPSTLNFSTTQGTISQTVRLFAILDSSTDDEEIIISFSSDEIETVDINITRRNASSNWI
jgi:hypothetical protein